MLSDTLQEDKAIIEELLKKKKSELGLVLTEINKEEQKREHCELKMEALLAKVHRLKSEEERIKKGKPGKFSVSLHRIARDTGIAVNANLAYATKVHKHRINIEKLQSQEVDKKREIQMLKWKRRQFETSDTSSCNSLDSSP